MLGMLRGLPPFFATPTRRPRRCGLVILLIVIAVIQPANGCPFCSALPRTLSDDLEDSAVAVIVSRGAIVSAADGFHTYQMQVRHVLKGDRDLESSTIEVAAARKLDRDREFLVIGYGETDTQWGLPKDISTDAIGYLRGFSGLPEKGPTRLEYFLGFLACPDPLVAADAYNEFAEASLDDIAAFKHKLDRAWVIEQLRDKSIPVHRRRLCWTFLSMCGTPDDTKRFEELIRQRELDSDFNPGMDAAIGCYITLGGEAALRRIEREFLVDPNASYGDLFAAISAIRVHGTEGSPIERERLAAALRLVLDRADQADLVIADLARWKDWTAMDRIVALFKEAKGDHRMLKSAAVLYLKACPLPVAEQKLDELRMIDGDAVKLAEASMLLYNGLPSVPVPPPDQSDDAISKRPDGTRAR